MHLQALYFFFSHLVNSIHSPVLNNLDELKKINISFSIKLNQNYNKISVLNLYFFKF